MNRIDAYDDYRKFLRDCYADRKRRRKGYSYRSFNLKAGISSPSLFMEVSQGKRNLTPKTLPAFVKGLGLTDTDAKYFKALVMFNQSPDPAQKELALEELRGLKRRVCQQVVPLDHYAYYAVWHNVILRELATLADWKSQYKRLAKLVDPPITVREARESIQRLVKLGFLVRRADGRHVQKDPAITTGPEVVSLAVRRFNRRMAQFGAQAVDAYTPEEREISSLVVGISAKGYNLIKQEIREFKSRVVRIVEDDKQADQVYNLNVQLFPKSLKAGGAP